MTILSSVKRASITALTLVSLFQAVNVSANSLEGMHSGTYNVDLTHASVIWKVSHFGFSTYVGRFNDFSADIALDSENFAKSTVDVSIKVDSLDTDYPFPEKEDFNKTLSEDWLKSADHPSITFKTTSVSELNGSNFTINGDLTIVGETHPVVLNATLNGSTPSHPISKIPVVGFSATTTIDRTVWGVSKYAPSVGAQISIEIEGEYVNNAK